MSDTNLIRRYRELLAKMDAIEKSLNEYSKAFTTFAKALRGEITDRPNWINTASPDVIVFLSFPPFPWRDIEVEPYEPRDYRHFTVNIGQDIHDKVTALHAARHERANLEAELRRTGLQDMIRVERPKPPGRRR